MAKKQDKENRAKNGVALRPVGSKKVKTRASAREVLHTTLRQSGMSYSQAKAISGTSHGCTGTLEQQRDKALAALDITLHSQFKTLKNVRDSKNSCNSDKIHAVKTINSMVPGWTAPDQVEIKSVGVFAELTGLSSRELTELSSLMGVAAQDTEFSDVSVVSD